MKEGSGFVIRSLIAGLLILAPVYLSVLLLLTAMRSLSGPVKPLAKLLPGWLPATQIVSLLLVSLLCFLTGVVVKTQIGHAAWARIEQWVIYKIPGYTVVQSLIEQLAGDGEKEAWKPALAAIGVSLVPAFIIEKHDDGRFTVFVPAVPTAFSGAIHILPGERVHPLNVSFAQAVRVISRWGMGCKDLAAERLKIGVFK